MQSHFIGVSFLRCKRKVLQIYFFLNYLLMEKSFHVLISRACFFFFDISLRGILCGGGQGEWETGRKVGGRCTGGGRRGGGKREKKGKITQHCAILRNLKKMQRGGSQQIQSGNRD